MKQNPYMEKCDPKPIICFWPYLSSLRAPTENVLNLIPRYKTTQDFAETVIYLHILISSQFWEYLMQFSSEETK